jgi:hypothetical protein
MSLNVMRNSDMDVLSSRIPVQSSDLGHSRGFFCDGLPAGPYTGTWPPSSLAHIATVMGGHEIRGPRRENPPYRRLHARAVTVDQSRSAIGLRHESRGCGGTASARLTNAMGSVTALVSFHAPGLTHRATRARP